MWFQITNLPQMGYSFWKVDKHHFCLTMEPHHPATFQTNPHKKLHNFDSYWVQIAHFPQEIFSGKTDCYYPTTTFQKKISE